MIQQHTGPIIAILVAVFALGPAAATAQILDDLPSIAKVKASKTVAEPSRYLIHILDWHLVSKDLFFADLRDQGITDGLAAKYEQHLDDVERVQAEQKTLLAALAKPQQSGLRAALIASLSFGNIVRRAFGCKRLGAVMSHAPGLLRTDHCITD